MNWGDIEKKAQEQGVSKYLVGGEILHIAYLDALYQEPISQKIHFHGGTSIRLLHRGWRYSEDLDFATVIDDDARLNAAVQSSVLKCRQTLELMLGPQTFQLALKHKKARSNLQIYWLHLTRIGERQPYKVKMEFANFPVHQPQPFAVSRPDLELPITPLVMAESLPELLADKISAFAGRPYLKGRDVFDLWYLHGVLQVPVDPVLIAKKFVDYRVDDPLHKLANNLARISADSIDDEMRRFLPEPYATRLALDRYATILTTTENIVRAVIA